MVTSECDGEPLRDVRVQLRGSPSIGIREEITDPAGMFRFQGVDPGTPHSLDLSTLVPPGDFFPFRMENVSLAEAATDSVSIEMMHRRDCAQ